MLVLVPSLTFIDHGQWCTTVGQCGYAYFIKHTQPTLRLNMLQFDVYILLSCKKLSYTRDLHYKACSSNPKCLLRFFIP